MLEIFFRIIGWLLYATDVITDAMTGFTYLDGPKIDTSRFGKENFSDYTMEICQDFENYSHPIWGSLAIGLTWAPALACIPGIFEALKFFKKRDEELKVGYWSVTFLLVFLLILLWPVLGIVM